jgi:glutathione S-transferase
LSSLTSPYARKVRIVLAEKKIDFDLVLDSPWEPGNKVASLNPLGKVPVLVLDDDSTLFDSRVIAEYLDTVAPNNRLIPASGRVSASA